MVTAVSTGPIRPPMPWMPNTSSESSKPSLGFAFITNQQQAMPAIAPSRIAPNGPELPAAGVTATRPAIAPEQAPSSEPLWPSARSVSLQKRTPAAVAVKGVLSARPAEPLASGAEQALKPNTQTGSDSGQDKRG